MEITQILWKRGFLWTENTFSKSLNTFLASKFHIQSDRSVTKPIAFEVWKTFPKRLLIRKHITSLQNSTFSQTKERTFAYSVLIDIPIRFHAPHTLGAGAASWEHSWEHSNWYQIGLVKLFVDINIHSKQSIINSIVHSQFRLASAFANLLDACLVTLAHILSTSS